MEVSTITPRVLITCDKSKQVAHFSVTRGIDDYVGDYTREDATMHEGDIINPRNFLTYITAAIAPGNNAITLLFPSDAKAAVTVNITTEFAGEKFSDSITAICMKVEVPACDQKLREVRLECLKLREEILELRRGREEDAAIATFCARWNWQLPFEGRDFYLAIIRRVIRSDPVTFPLVGPDFIRIGNKFFSCRCLGIKTHNIVCCTEPQNNGANLSADREITSTQKIGTYPAIASWEKHYAQQAGTPDSVVPDQMWTFLAAARDSAYAKLVREMMNHACGKSLAIIGCHLPINRARYIALMSSSASSYKLAQTLMSIWPPTAYVAFQGDTITYFGIALDPKAFVTYYDSKNERANTREPITREFDTACSATAELEKLAISSGLEEYKPRAACSYSVLTGTIPDHP